MNRIKGTYQDIRALLLAMLYMTPKGKNHPAYIDGTAMLPKHENDRIKAALYHRVYRLDWIPYKLRYYGRGPGIVFYWEFELTGEPVNDGVLHRKREMFEYRVMQTELPDLRSGNCADGQ